MISESRTIIVFTSMIIFLHLLFIKLMFPITGYCPSIRGIFIIWKYALFSYIVLKSILSVIIGNRGE
ncbi:hypothetical protein CVD28_26055 [Bacillus sp. M6-12]|nr:hypothetical protein CVD28_26055 [Bacillus sp. M6-12]